MRISDWSSDVCSSDLIARPPRGDQRARTRRRLDHHRADRKSGDDTVARRKVTRERLGAGRLLGDQQLVGRDLVLQRSIFGRSEEHTSELQSLMRISYAVFCLKKKNTNKEKTIVSTYHNR